MSDKPTIRVEATGTASAAPDIARIRLFTFAEDPAPGDALTSCSLLTDRVLAALRDAGIASSDLETTSIDLNQQHRREAEASVQNYRASSSLVATVRPPADAGRIIAAAVDAAGTGVGINDVSFDIDDRAPLTSLARRDAVARAVSAAHELADAAGLVLAPFSSSSKVWGCNHTSGAAGSCLVPRQRKAHAADRGAGELSMAVTVSAVFRGGSRAMLSPSCSPLAGRTSSARRRRTLSVPWREVPPFRVVSDFQPAGDQPAAIDALARG